MSANSVFEPSPEHIWLDRNVGEWTIECAYHTIPGEDPIEVEGREVTERLGPFWVVGRFEADMMGTPIIGQTVTGYDPVKKVFVSTWKDNYTPFHYGFEGELNEDENALVLTGENYDPLRQGQSIYHSRTDYLNDKERVLGLSVESDDGQVAILEYRYTRKS